jgi:hypothetical protein
MAIIQLLNCQHKTQLGNLKTKDQHRIALVKILADEPFSVLIGSASQPMIHNQVNSLLPCWLSQLEHPVGIRNLCGWLLAQLALHLLAQDTQLPSRNQANSFEAVVTEMRQANPHAG